MNAKTMKLTKANFLDFLLCSSTILSLIQDGKDPQPLLKNGPSVPQVWSCDRAPLKKILFCQTR